MARICGIGAVALSLTVCKLRRTDEGQKARNSCLRLLSGLSADHVRFWPNRSAMLRRCLHVVWSVMLTDHNVAQVRSYMAFAVVYP